MAPDGSTILRSEIMDERAINVLRRVAAREEGHAVELKKTRAHQLLSKDLAGMVERIKKIGRGAIRTT